LFEARSIAVPAFVRAVRVERRCTAKAGCTSNAALVGVERAHLATFASPGAMSMTDCAIAVGVKQRAFAGIVLDDRRVRRLGGIVEVAGYDASTWKRCLADVSIGSAPNAIGPDPPSRRSLISRIRASRSASTSANSSSEISPISRRISASSSASRSAVSSFISASAAVTTVRSAHEMPEIMSESRMNIGLM
jgi:hypothetical protein